MSSQGAVIFAVRAINSLATALTTQDKLDITARLVKPVPGGHKRLSETTLVPAVEVQQRQPLREIACLKRSFSDPAACIKRKNRDTNGVFAHFKD